MGHQRLKSRISSPFFYCHTTPPRLFEPKNLEIVTGNSPIDEDRKNTFGILICAEICDGAGAGICDGAPSTCSSFPCYYSDDLISGVRCGAWHF